MSKRSLKNWYLHWKVMAMGRCCGLGLHFAVSLTTP